MADTLDNKPAREGAPRKLGDIDMTPAVEAKPADVTSPTLVTDTDVVDTTSLDEPVIENDTVAEVEDENEYFANQEQDEEPPVLSEGCISFEAAKTALEGGAKIRRESWLNAHGYYAMRGDTVAYFSARTPDGIVPVVFEKSDRVAGDWVILPELPE